VTPGEPLTPIAFLDAPNGRGRNIQPRRQRLAGIIRLNRIWSTPIHFYAFPRAFPRAFPGPIPTHSPGAFPTHSHALPRTPKNTAMRTPLFIAGSPETREQIQQPRRHTNTNQPTCHCHCNCCRYPLLPCSTHPLVSRRALLLSYLLQRAVRSAAAGVGALLLALVRPAAAGPAGRAMWTVGLGFGLPLDCALGPYEISTTGLCLSWLVAKRAPTSRGSWLAAARGPWCVSYSVLCTPRFDLNTRDQGAFRLDQLRDHTGQKRRYWLVLKEIIRAAPCFFLRVLAWH
jgi:hypothetical protein